MADSVELELASWQQEVMEDYVSDITCVTAGYGSGKTFLTVLWCLDRLAYNPECDGIYLEPQYALVKRVAIPAFQEVLSLLGYKNRVHYTIYKSADNMRVEFCTGQTIFFVTGEKPDSIIGMTTIAFAVEDEAAISCVEAHNNIRSRTRYKKAVKCQVLLVTTPEGYGWVSDEFDGEAQPGWFNDESRRNTMRKWVDIELPDGSIHKSLYTWVRVETMDNSHNLAPSFIPNLFDTWGFNQAYVDSYIYGWFRPFATGLAYSNYRNPVHKTPKYNPTPQKPIHFTWDFNIAPAWATIQQIREYTDKGYVKVWQVYDCADGDAVTTEEAVLEFAAKHPRSIYNKTPIYIYGDRSGYSSTHKVKGNDYEEIVRILKRLGYKYVEVMAIKANPQERVSVDFVQAAFADNILKIGENCAMVLKSLVRTCWKDGKRAALDKPANDTWTHPMDAIKYFFCAIERNARRRMHTGR